MKKHDSTTQKDYFVVIDFESTCEEENVGGYIHEIIEFPAILVNAATLELVCKMLPSHLLFTRGAFVSCRMDPLGMDFIVLKNIIQSLLT